MKNYINTFTNYLKFTSWAAVAVLTLSTVNCLAESSDADDEKKAVAGEYTVEFALTSDAKVGRTDYEFTVKDNSGEPVTGLTPELTATMDMMTMKHTTPVGPIVESGAGVYTGSIYFIMASMDGMGWSGNIQIAGQDYPVEFPDVMGPMDMMDMMEYMGKLSGSTEGADLTDGYDAFLMDGMASARPYFIFPHSSEVNDAGDREWLFFIGTRATLMDHPALQTHLEFENANGTEYHVHDEDIVVQVSDDMMNYTAAEARPGGYYAVTAPLAEHPAASDSMLRVKLAIKNIAKTRMDGNTEYDYAAIKISNP